MDFVAASVDLTAGGTTGYINIPGGVTIPAGGTYGFWVGRSDGGTVQYTNVCRNCRFNCMGFRC